MKTISIPYIPALILLASAYSAQPTVAMTEFEAAMSGLANNHDVRILKDGMELDSLELIKLKSNWLPAVGLSGAYQNRILDTSRLATPLGNVSAGGKSTLRSFDVILDQSLPGGGAITGSSLLASQSGDRTDSTVFNIKQSLGYNQPLLRNAWGHSDLEYSLRIMGIDNSVRDLDRMEALSDLLSDIRRAYWLLYRQTVSLTLSRDKEAFFNRQLHFVLSRFKVGTASELDTLFQSLETAKASQAVLEAGHRVRIARIRLANLIAVDTASLELRPGDEIQAPLPPPADSLWNAIVAWDPTLRAFEKVRNRWDEESARWKNSLLPSLDLGVNQTFEREGTGLSGAGSALSGNLTAQVRLSYDFPTTARSLSYRQAEVGGRRAAREKAKRGLHLKERLEEALSVYEALRLAQENLERSRAIAAKQLSLSEQKFATGGLDALAFQKTRSDFDEISSSLLDSKIDLKLWQVLLERLDGTALRRFRIK